MQLVIKEFYPSVSEETLNKAFNFAENHTLIYQENRKSYFNLSRELSNYKTLQSLLFYKNELWKKKEHESYFDVAMGSYNDAELCELIGIYMQSLQLVYTEMMTYNPLQYQ